MLAVRCNRESTARCTASSAPAVEAEGPEGEQDAAQQVVSTGGEPPAGTHEPVDPRLNRSAGHRGRAQTRGNRVEAIRVGAKTGPGYDRGQRPPRTHCGAGPATDATRARAAHRDLEGVFRRVVEAARLAVFGDITLHHRYGVENLGRDRA